jgi:hypothetical protein
LTEKNSFATLQFSRFAPACRHTWRGSWGSSGGDLTIAVGSGLLLARSGTEPQIFQN